MIYHKVINGEIVEYHRTLPFSNATTSFGANVTAEEMATYNYYLELDTVSGFNPNTQTESVSYEVDDVSQRVTKRRIAVDIPLDDLKAKRIGELKEKFNAITNSKPRVNTTLGYFVDGGRDNKDDFFSKWESMLDTDTTTVRDADNQFHIGVTRAQMQTIYRAIVANGEALLTWKWNKEMEINSCTTSAEVMAVVI